MTIEWDTATDEQEAAYFDQEGEADTLMAGVELVEKYGFTAGSGAAEQQVNIQVLKHPTLGVRTFGGGNDYGGYTGLMTLEGQYPREEIEKEWRADIEQGEADEAVAVTELNASFARARAALAAGDAETALKEMKEDPAFWRARPPADVRAWLDRQRAKGELTLREQIIDKLIGK